MTIHRWQALMLGLAVACGSVVTAGPREPRQPAPRGPGRVIREDASRFEWEARFSPPRLDVRSSPDGAWTEATVAGVRALLSPDRAFLPEVALPIALPLGAIPRLTVVDLSEEDLGAAPPPGIGIRDPDRGGTVVVRPLGPGEAASSQAVAGVVDLGIARHLRLGRVVVRPARYDAVEGRWLAVRSIRLRVDFESPARPGGDSGESVAQDAMDRHLASTVLNPSAVASALTSGGGSPVGFASIPAPEPSVMTPLKILVREDGIHEVGYADVTGAGVDPTGIDPATFVLTNRGVEIAMQVTGEGDGSFDPGDVIRFYGERVGGDETLDNVYRLTGGDHAGLRMAGRDATPNVADPIPTRFPNTAYAETNELFWASLPDAAPGPWYWDALPVSTPGVPVYVDVPVVLSNVSTDPGTARLEVGVQSRRETPGADPNHHARIYLNGNLVDDQTWTGLLNVTLAGDVPQSWVLEGTNTVRIENPADLGLTAQEEWTDWIHLEYDDRFVAEADYLEFGTEATGPWRFQVSGFSGAGLVVYDVRDPSAPVLLSGVGEAFDGSTWVADLSDAVSTPPARFVGLRPGGAKTAHALVVDELSTLRAQAASGADMLIVAHDGFFDAIGRLVTHRQDQGLRVVAGRLTDVYDEFNGGIAEIQGIRNFVQWAFDNYAPPAPAYLLLVGDATYDPADYLGEGDNDVPTRFSRESGFGLAPSETWFGAVSGADDVPDLAVGRISVRSVAELEDHLDNLLDYENLPPVSDLNSGLLYVADDDDPVFEDVLEDLIDRFQPPTMLSRRVYMSGYASGNDAKSDIRNAIDAGSLVTTYMGHGGRGQWASEKMWVTADVASLAASNRLTFALALNCVNGWFANLDLEPYSLGEEWGRLADRGAACAWTPSATGTVSNYDILSDQLFEEIFVQRETRLGYAAWQALLDAFFLWNVGSEYVRTMVFFGDPAAYLPLDSDRDGLLERDEIAAGTDPDDTDTDDDGLTDDQEPSWDTDSDGDGLVNAADYDSDGDGLPDGLESGVVTPPSGTDTSVGHFVADGDPGSTTDPNDPDTDLGGAPDGAEDRNVSGAVDTGETDPNVPADDPVCAAGPPPEVQNVLVGKSVDDLEITWDSLVPSDPCVLYRVHAYASQHAESPTTFGEFVYEGTVTESAWTDLGAGADVLHYFYLVSGESLAHGEGPLGHYGL